MIAGAVLALAAAPGAAHAQNGLPAQPIPQGTAAGEGADYVGAPATPRPLVAPQPPRHPFMAPNGDSNLHDDAWQTDAYVRPGPLGRDMLVRSTAQFRECASVTFDSRGRIVTVCVGLEGPVLALFDAESLALLAELPLPVRDPTGGDPFTSFAGGGYFYLDHRDRVVVPTNTRQIWVIAQTETAGRPGFRVERTYDLNGAVRPGDGIISALPDWDGLLWFASVDGVVGTLDLASGAIRSVEVREHNGNSFAVDETGAVYIVTDAALYRFDAAANGTPEVTWRETYANVGSRKPGQTQAGSGTTPTVMASGHVAITDNADPMNVLVLQRRRRARGDRVVCTQPVFSQGASATDNSLIVAGRRIVVENNFGYSIGATMDENTTVGGVERVDLERDGRGCRKVWHSDEISPSVVPKLSLANGLVYLYTKPNEDAWYLTAIDLRTGETRFRKRSGGGLGFNNHYAPISLGRDGNAYVGVLGGLVLLRDAVPPPRAQLDLALRLRHGHARDARGRPCAPGAVTATLAGSDTDSVERARFAVGARTVGTADDDRPFRRRLGWRAFGRAGAHTVRVHARLADGRTETRSRRVRVCAAGVGPRFTG